MYKYFVISLILIKTGISSFGNAALRLFIKQLSGVLVDPIIAYIIIFSTVIYFMQVQVQKMLNLIFCNYIPLSDLFGY